ncbi:MAG: prepilin-type N-terminal cleavage/methylation domain-containing protein, partial [Desulfotignum sp.]|nr:prepilin-type N-terminal cleavage/methylation domain-containing protein [Desulfotignum sp.]
GRDNSGFTLIEMALVLVIIAFFTTLAVKHMGGSEMSAYGDADRLVADLRYAQFLAMTRSKNITVEIKSDGWTISDLSFADGVGSDDKRETEHGVTFPSGSRIKIEFSTPKGTVDSEKNIELKRGNKTVRLKIYQTGYVEIQ